MRKIFTLMFLVMSMFSLNMKAADAVSATQTLSNDSKTCTWTDVIATGSLGNEDLISGNGIVLDCKLAKASASGGTSQLNVKAGGILYLQVPSADAAGSLKLVGSANDRYFVTNSGTNVYTSKTATEYNFTAADVVTISGKYYLQLTSMSDCKINQGFSITVTSSTAYPEIKEVVQELDAVSVGGVALSETDFNTLKSTKTVTLSGVSYNGVPGCEITLKEGATGFTRTISEGNVTFAFTLNKTENYTVIVPIEAKGYSQNGVIVAAEAEMNTNDFEVDGIALAMTDADKKFTPGAAKVTIDETPYPCLKLSTGCGVNVTLPEGKVAKKITVYGWSVSNNGKLTQLKESEESAKSVDVSNDIFLSGNTKDDIYPSAYTYELNNWESIYFTAAGSPSQPCVVLDIELADKPAAKVAVTDMSLTVAEGEEFDSEDGTFKVTFNYTTTKFDESIMPSMSFKVSVFDSENNPVVENDTWPATFSSTSRGVYISDLEGSKQYTVKVVEVSVKANVVVGEDVVSEELLKITEGLPTLTFTTPEKVVAPVEIKNMSISNDKNALIDDEGDYEMAFNYTAKINDETLTADDIYATFSYEVYDEVYNVVASDNRDFSFAESTRSFYPSGLTAGKSYTVFVTGIKVYGKGTDPILEVTSGLPKLTFKVKDPNAPQAISMSNMSFTVAEGEKLDEDSEFKITFNYTATINDASAINDPYPAMTWEIVDEEGTKVDGSVADFYIDATSRNLYAKTLVEGKTYTIKATKIEIQDLVTMAMLCETTQNLPTLTFTVGSATGINDATSAEVKAVKKYIKNGKVVVEKNGKKYGVNAVEVK